mgnify:CR=1 FL=1
MLKNKFKFSIFALLISANSFSEEITNLNSLSSNSLESKIKEGGMSFLKNYLKDKPNSFLSEESNLNLITLLAMSKTDNIYNMTKYALNNGVIDVSSYKGIGLREIAFERQNFDFIRALNDHYNDVYKNKEYMTTNSYTDYELTLKENIYNAFIGDKIKKIENDKKSSELLIKMILKGYNKAAKALIDKNKYDDEYFFQKNEDGISPLIATVLSSVFGGNVEFLSYIYERNSSLFTNEVIIEIINISFVRDNFKIVYFLLSKSNLASNDLAKLQRVAIKEYNALRVANIIDKKISKAY